MVFPCELLQLLQLQKHKLDGELQQPVRRKFQKCIVVTSFLDNISGAGRVRYSTKQNEVYKGNDLYRRSQKSMLRDKVIEMYSI